MSASGITGRIVLKLCVVALGGCDAWTAVDEPPAAAYLLENAAPVARAILEWYGETDLRHPPIFGVPADLERCDDQTFWHPGMGECIGGARRRDSSVIYIVVSPTRATYGRSFLCHELAHEILARDGDSDGHHQAIPVWEYRSGDASLEAQCWRWVLASPGLNVEMR